MFDYFNLNNHYYSLAATGVKFKGRTFSSRALAEKCMYKFFTKKGLKVDHIYDDKHYKTYICTNGARFYINRIY